MSEAKPKRGDWCVIEHEPPRAYYLRPTDAPKAAEPGTRFALARVVRASREGLISHACPPRQWERGPKATSSNRVLAPATSHDWIHVRKVWALPRGMEIDDDLAEQSFCTEDEVKAALRERLPAREAA